MPGCMGVDEGAGRRVGPVRTRTASATGVSSPKRARRSTRHARVAAKAASNDDEPKTDVNTALVTSPHNRQEPLETHATILVTKREPPADSPNPFRNAELQEAWIETDRQDDAALPAAARAVDVSRDIVTIISPPSGTRSSPFPEGNSSGVSQDRLGSGSVDEGYRSASSIRDPVAPSASQPSLSAHTPHLPNDHRPQTPSSPSLPISQTQRPRHTTLALPAHSSPPPSPTRSPTQRTSSREAAVAAFVSALRAHTGLDSHNMLEGFLRRVWDIGVERAERLAEERVELESIGDEDFETGEAMLEGDGDRSEWEMDDWEVDEVEDEEDLDNDDDLTPKPPKIGRGSVYA